MKHDDDTTITLPLELYRRLRRAAEHEHCACSVTGCSSYDWHLENIESNVESALEDMLEKEENEMVAAACPHGDEVEAELEARIEAYRRGARIRRVK